MSLKRTEYLEYRNWTKFWTFLERTDYNLYIDVITVLMHVLSLVW